MSVLPDPITDIIGLFLKKAMDSKLWQMLQEVWRRVQLLLELLVAGSIAFFAACGIALVSHVAPAVAIGAGMIAAAVALLATFQASPNSKGLVISLPQAAAQEKLDSPMTTIERK